MAGWVTWQQQIWAADKRGGEAGSPPWPAWLWRPEPSCAALLSARVAGAWVVGLPWPAQAWWCRSSCRPPPGGPGSMSHGDGWALSWKARGFSQSCQLQANLSVVGGRGGVWWKGTADDWVALAVSPLQSKQVQTEMKTEPSFCLPGQLSLSGSTSMPEPWRLLWNDRPAWAKTWVPAWANRQHRQIT